MVMIHVHTLVHYFGFKKPNYNRMLLVQVAYVQWYSSFVFRKRRAASFTRCKRTGTKSLEEEMRRRSTGIPEGYI